MEIRIPFTNKSLTILFQDREGSLPWIIEHVISSTKDPDSKLFLVKSTAELSAIHPEYFQKIGAVRHQDYFEEYGRISLSDAKRFVERYILI